MGKNTDLSQYITTGKAAELLGCNAGRIRQWLLNGYVPAIKVGPRAWLVHKASVLRFKPRRVGRPKEK